MDYVKLVEELNKKLKKRKPLEDLFFYATSGYADIIGFGEITLWNSDNDDREWIEEDNSYEPIKPFLVKKLSNYGKHLLELTDTPTYKVFVDDVCIATSYSIEEAEAIANMASRRKV